MATAGRVLTMVVFILTTQATKFITALQRSFEMQFAQVLYLCSELGKSSGPLSTSMVGRRRSVWLEFPPPIKFHVLPLYFR
jgi:hypothetical protein